MTKEELIKELEKLPDGVEIFIAGDEEGNDYYPVAALSVATARWHYTEDKDESDPYRWVDGKLFEVEEWHDEEELYPVNLKRTEAYVLWPGWPRMEELFRD